MEKDLLRKGKSPLEVLLEKRRILRAQGADAATSSVLTDHTTGGGGGGGARGASRGFWRGPGNDEELTVEETIALDELTRGTHHFSVKEEVGMSNDISSTQM